MTTRDVPAADSRSRLSARDFSMVIALAAIGAPFVEAWGRITGTEPLYNRESLSALRHGRAFPHDEAAADLGYAPRPLEATVADTIAWFRSRAAG